MEEKKLLVVGIVVSEVWLKRYINTKSRKTLLRMTETLNVEQNAALLILYLQLAVLGGDNSSMFFITPLNQATQRAAQAETSRPVRRST